jgi:hypothetical protein
MPYLAIDLKRYLGDSVGDGQCVAYVRAASGAPHAQAWQRGYPVKEASTLVPGTVIATFDANGQYGNRKDGTCHAAIFVRRAAGGIVVLDQWITHGVRQPVHERMIRFDTPGARKINNGDAYFVVE